MVSPDELDHSPVLEKQRRPLGERNTKAVPRLPAKKSSSENENMPKTKTRGEKKGEKQLKPAKVLVEESDREDSSNESEESTSEKVVTIPKDGDLSRSLLHQPTPKMLELMCKAIEEIDDKKGATVQGIKKWILDHYPETNVGRMKYMMQKAIERGLQNEVLVRPKASVDSKGLTGRFKVGNVKKAKTMKKHSKPATKKESSKKSAPEDPEHEPSTKNNKPPAAEKVPDKAVKKPVAKKSAKLAKEQSAEVHHEDPVGEVKVAGKKSSSKQQLVDIPEVVQKLAEVKIAGNKKTTKTAAKGPEKKPKEGKK